MSHNLTTKDTVGEAVDFIETYLDLATEWGGTTEKLEYTLSCLNGCDDDELLMEETIEVFDEELMQEVNEIRRNIDTYRA